MPNIMLARDVCSGMPLYFPPIRWGVNFYAQQPMGARVISQNVPPLRQSEGGFLLLLSIFFGQRDLLYEQGF
jgi:hypothetical protein